ncbi:MAG: hypothetical protein J6R31_02800 [Rikenellaceae bacterium]|nr:hypothetical protein [Rikenellaceae bacterium]
MKKYFLLFAAALVLGVTACVDTPEPAPDPIVPELSVDVESIEATIEGLDTEFNITSNVEWAVTTEQDWISIDPAMGEGNSLVLVTVDENKTYDVREGAITVEVVGEFAGQVETITIPVVQDEVKAAILDAKSKYEFEKEGGSFSVTMKANVEYSVELGADWLSIAEADATRALKEDVITINVAANTSYDAREAVVTITSDLGEDQIKVVQAEDRTVIVEAEPENYVSYEGGQVKVAVTQNMTYKTECTVDWITKAKGSRALETDSLTFDVAANPTSEVRGGYIIISSEVCVDSIAVAQAGNPAAVVAITDSRMVRVLGDYDTNEDGEFQLSELQAITEISFTKQGKDDSWTSETTIKDWSALKYMTNLEKLNVSSCTMTALDVTTMPNLKELRANNTRIAEIDLSNNTALTYLDLGLTKITALDLSNNTALTEVQVSGNALTELNVSALKDLKVLNVAYNKIAAIDLSNNTALEGVYVNGNQLTELNVSALAGLKRLNCEHNQISSLDVTSNSQLVVLNCGRNKLASLNVSGLAELAILSANYNAELSTVDLSGLNKLRAFNAPHSGLTSLAVSGCPALTQVVVNDCKLTGFDFAAAPAALRSVIIDGANPLTGSIDLSKTAAYNQIKLLYADVATLESIKIPSWINLFTPPTHIIKNEATKWEGGFYLEPQPLDLSANGTSNCYIVNKADTLYRFKATVKGNGVAALGDDQTTIAPTKARLLWAMAGWQMTPGDADNAWPSNLGDGGADGIIKAESVTLAEDGYIEFATGAAMPNGNALIIATDDNDNVLWSWHIWALNDYDAASEDHYVTTHGLNVYMMDRNIGATSDPSDIAEPTMCDWVGTRGLYYQWGRKDPFYGSIKFNGYAAKMKLWAADGTVSTPYAIYGSSCATQKVGVGSIEGWSGIRSSIDFATANPLTYITSASGQNYSWLWSANAGGNGQTEWGKLWGNPEATALGGVKTMYDPCPVGYSIPAPGKFAFITSHNDDATAYYNYDVDWKYNCREKIFADTLNGETYPTLNSATFKVRPYGLNFYIHGAKTPAEVEEGAQNYGVEPEDKTVAYFPVQGPLTYSMGDQTYRDDAPVTAMTNAPAYSQVAYSSQMFYFMSASYVKGDFYRYNVRSISYGDQFGKALPVRCFRENEAVEGGEAIDFTGSTPATR